MAADDEISILGDRCGLRLCGAVARECDGEPCDCSSMGGSTTDVCELDFLERRDLLSLENILSWSCDVVLNAASHIRTAMIRRVYLIGWANLPIIIPERQYPSLGLRILGNIRSSTQLSLNVLAPSPRHFTNFESSDGVLKNIGSGPSDEGKEKADFHHLITRLLRGWADGTRGNVKR